MTALRLSQASRPGGDCLTTRAEGGGRRAVASPPRPSVLWGRERRAFSPPRPPAQVAGIVACFGHRPAGALSPCPPCPPIFLYTPYAIMPFNAPFLRVSRISPVFQYFFHFMGGQTKTTRTTPAIPGQILSPHLPSSGGQTKTSVPHFAANSTRRTRWWGDKGDKFEIIGKNRCSRFPGGGEANALNFHPRTGCRRRPIRCRPSIRRECARQSSPTRGSAGALSCPGAARPTGCRFRPPANSSRSA